MMPEQADENTIALSKKFEATKLRNDTTCLPVFVIERISLLVRADQVLYSEYRSTEDTTRGTRSGAVLLITSDSVVTVDFKDVEDGVQRRRDAPGQVTVLVRPSDRPTRIELAGAQNQPSQFLKAESLKLTFEGFDRVLALPLTDRPLTDRRDTGGAYVRGVLGVFSARAPRHHA
jgi:hypothetical protein